MAKSRTLDQYEGPLLQENILLAQLHRQRQSRLKLQSKTQQVSKSQTAQISSPFQLKASPFCLNQLLYSPRLPNTITLHSLLSEDPLTRPQKQRKKVVKCAFITTFGFESEVFLELVEKGTQLFLMNQWDQPAVFRNYMDYPNWTIIRPNMTKKKYSVFHAKLWLLKFEGFLRVVVCSANNHVGDWALWLNSFWFQDFKQQAQQKDLPQIDLEFKRNLSFFYQNVFIKKQQRQIVPINLDQYNFKGLDVHLVMSMPVKYPQDMQFGLDQIQRLVPAPRKPNKIVYQTTSLGVLNKKLLERVRKAFKGEQLRVLYPSYSYLQKVECSPDTLFLKRSNFFKEAFDKTVMHQLASSLPFNYIPHLKMVIALQQHIQDSSVVYMGSHNLTQAAWGDSVSGQNTQLGVLFRMDKDSHKLKREVLERVPFKLESQQFKKWKDIYMVQ